MVIYFATLLIVVLAVHQAYRSRPDRPNGTACIASAMPTGAALPAKKLAAATIANPKRPRIMFAARRHGFLLVAASALILTASVRSENVGTIGTDTLGYVATFDQIRTFEDAIDIGSKIGDYAFWILTWGVALCSNQYAIYLSVMAAIGVGCFSFSIIRSASYRLDPVISFFVFITMGFYTSIYNVARQGIAVGIYALCIRFLIQRQIILYCLGVLCASLFHQSALLMLPMYYLLNYKIKGRVLAFFKATEIA